MDMSEPCKPEDITQMDLPAFVDFAIRAITDFPDELLEQGRWIGILDETVGYAYQPRAERVVDFVTGCFTDTYMNAKEIHACAVGAVLVTSGPRAVRDWLAAQVTSDWALQDGAFMLFSAMSAIFEAAPSPIIGKHATLDFLLGVQAACNEAAQTLCSENYRALGGIIDTQKSEAFVSMDLCGECCDAICQCESPETCATCGDEGGDCGECANCDLRICDEDHVTCVTHSNRCIALCDACDACGVRCDSECDDTASCGACATVCSRDHQHCDVHDQCKEICVSGC